MATTFTDIINRQAARLTAREPYFADRIELARRYTAYTSATNGGIRYPDGYTVGPHGCDCPDALGGLECIHKIGWRLYTTAEG